jgi:aminocarboxymuconate-semialdehyde decarboxylase
MSTVWDDNLMINRRKFVRGLAAASATASLFGTSSLHASKPATTRRFITIDGKRLKTVDVHAHTTIPEVRELVKGTNIEKRAVRSPSAWGDMLITSELIQRMDEDGIDVRAVSINPFWYGADRELATRLIDLQNQKLSEACGRFPGRFVAYSTVALQFPELAAQQMETGMKHLGLRGASIAGTVLGEELSSPRFDPFWAKAEELQAPILMHPYGTAAELGIEKHIEGDGVLSNVVGHPLETTLFISHLIFGGVLDRFPRLQICCVHGGGFLPSYADRMDHGCSVFPAQCKGTTKKRPSEYLKQLYFDSLVFTPEAVRHLVAVCGSSQIMIGTDAPIPWVEGSPIDTVLATPGLTHAEQIEILSTNACKFLGITA